jgi:LysM repeat protein
LAEPSSKPGKLHEKSEQEGAKYYRYTLKKGDNLFKVSKKFGVAIDDLFDANPGLFSEKLKA